MEVSSELLIAIAVLGVVFIAYQECKEDKEEDVLHSPPASSRPSPPPSPVAAAATPNRQPEEEEEEYHDMAVADAAHSYKLEYDRRFDESGHGAALERRRSVLRQEAAAASRPDPYMRLDGGQ